MGRFLIDMAIQVLLDEHYWMEIGRIVTCDLELYGIRIKCWAGQPH